MNRMAEVVAATDPKQAALLRQAFAESRQRLLDDQFHQAVELLAKDQLFAATRSQSQIQADLQKLLDLLQSGDQDKQNQSEREQLRKILARLDKMIKNVEGIRGLTEGEGDTHELADRQGREAERAKELAKDIKSLGAQDRIRRRQEQPQRSERRRFPRQRQRTRQGRRERPRRGQRKERRQGR